MQRILTLLLLLLWVVLGSIPVAVAFALKKKKLRGALAMLVCKGMVRLCGLHVRVMGELSTQRPLLVVSNHLSYLDIPILGSVMDCRFVPKKEIARWPLIGVICKIIDAVFVDRNPRKIGEASAAIANMLATGEVVALFPEATTGDGKRLLPFKPAFFEVAQGCAVQPVAIAYRKIRGLPMDYGQWPLIAWYGDMVLLPHLWKLLSLGKIEVEVHFLPPIVDRAGDRKMLALQSYDTIEAVLVGGQ